MTQMHFNINIYDNRIVSIFFFFLAYSYALTIPIAFPLKISEIALFLVFFLILIKQKIRVFNMMHPLQLSLLAFILFTILSTLLNLFWEYPYNFKKYDSRFGYQLDSILKLGYILVAYLAYIISTNALNKNPVKYLTYFLYGALIAACYGWYLVFSSLTNLPYLKLPGMDDDPQTMYIFGKYIVRCGTFKEGNYMGLFLLISGVIAAYLKKYRLMAFFFFTIFSTFSTASLIGVCIFCALHYFSTYFNKKHFHRFLVAAAASTVIFLLLFQIKAIRFLIADKVFGDTSNITHATYSKADRTNTTITAINIGNANPVMGVGISNYALHFDEYLADERFRLLNFKVIPNNIYAEILSETGYTGLLLFLIFIYYLFMKSTLDKTRILRNGLIVMLISFIAFPTFTLLFIWFYFGLIASLDSRRTNHHTASLETSE